MEYVEVSDRAIKLAESLELAARGITKDSDAKEVAKAFIVDAHRTNKQSMMRLINALLEEYENDTSDLRNAASVGFARTLAPARAEFNARAGLPYI